MQCLGQQAAGQPGLFLGKELVCFRSLAAGRRSALAGWPVLRLHAGWPSQRLQGGLLCACVKGLGGPVQCDVDTP